MAALARELAATEPEDWDAEAWGAARRLLQQRLTRECQAKEQELRRDPGGAGAPQLLQQIH